MANSIPIDYVVKVNPSVLAAAGAAIDLNGLLLTKHTAIPINTITPFASADDVAKFFGSNSTEAQAAKRYFAGYLGATKRPGILNIGQYNAESVPAYTRGGSISDITLDQIKAVTGTLSVTIDGVAKTAASINLSTATSFADAAAKIATTLSALVTYDAQREAFVIKSGVSGAASTIGYVTGTAADGLMLSQAKGAVLSQGAAASTPVAYMDYLVTNITQNWAMFTTAWEPDTANKVAFSTWANSRAPRYVYVGWDTDVLATQSGETTSWGYTIKYNKHEGSIPVYGQLDHAMLVLAWASSLDFDRLNGRATLAFKRQGGLTPYVTNQTDGTTLEAKGYNFYGSYATAKETFNFMYSGAISGSWRWADSYTNQIWMSANMQLAMVRLLLDVGSIPYNDDGYTLVEASLLDPIEKAVNFGGIRKGVALSNSQKEQIRFALGYDASPTILAKGWVLQIAPATADIRADRRSPSMTLYYTDGGSIQRLTLASIQVM